MDLQRRITAYHEAAHAVIAFRFGIPVRVVALCNAGPRYGYVETARPSLISGMRGKAASSVVWQEVVRDTEEHAAVFLAGPIAEARLYGTPLRSHCCESDLRQCYFLCEALREYGLRSAAGSGLSVPSINAAAMANDLRARTARILGHPRTWRAVAVLAGELETWSRLTGDEAADTVAWTRRIEKQLWLLLPIRPSNSQADAAADIAPRSRSSYQRPAIARSIAGARPDGPDLQPASS